MSRKNFMLSWVEHKFFITWGAGIPALAQILYFFSYMMGIFPFLNNPPKNLDPSYWRDLDFRDWFVQDGFGFSGTMEKLILWLNYTRLFLHICGYFGKPKIPSYNRINMVMSWMVKTPLAIYLWFFLEQSLVWAGCSRPLHHQISFSWLTFLNSVSPDLLEWGLGCNVNYEVWVLEQEVWLWQLEVVQVEVVRVQPLLFLFVSLSPWSSLKKQNTRAIFFISDMLALSALLDKCSQNFTCSRNI